MTIPTNMFANLNIKIFPLHFASNNHYHDLHDISSVCDYYTNIYGKIIKDFMAVYTAIK